MKTLILYPLTIAFFLISGYTYSQELSDTISKAIQDTLKKELPGKLQVKTPDTVKIKTPDTAHMQLARVTNWNKGWGLSLKVSSLGVGLEIIRRQSQFFSFRLGGTYLPYTFKKTDTEFEVEKTYNAYFSGATFLADWFIIGHFSSFHLSGGVVYNYSHLIVDGVPINTYSVGSYEIPQEQLGDVRIKLTPVKFSPYLGAGFGNFISNKKRLTFNVQLGVLYQAPPKVEFTATGMIEPTAEQDDIVAKNVEGFIFYPILDVQIVYRLSRIK